MLEDELAGLDLRQIEDVVDHLQQMLAVSLDGAKGLDAMRRRAIDPLFGQQQIGITENGRHGRADFVAHVGQKLALGLVGLLGGLFGQPQRLGGDLFVAHVADDAGEHAAGRPATLR